MQSLRPMPTKKGKIMEISTSQAAQLLGVTPVTIQKYVRQGRITARRHGVRNLLINFEELRQFAERYNMYFDVELAKELAQQ